MPIELYIVIFAGVIFALVVAAVWSLMDSSHAGVRARLQALGATTAATGNDAVSVIADDTPKNLGERVLVSIGSRQVETQKEESRESLRTLLRHAGFRRPSAVPIALGIRVTLMFGLPLLVGPALVAVLGAQNDWVMTLAVMAMPAIGGYMLPTFGLAKMVNTRQVAINSALPDVLDLLVLCMEAGLGLNAAIARVAEERGHQKDPLGAEFSQLANELRVGVPRRDALQNLASRVGSGDLRTVVAQLIHTERLGGNVAPALRAQSEAVREHRKLRTEEIANKLPVKMLAPTLVFIMPLFIVMFTPVVIKMIETFGAG
jgi:tight adherence protein C